MSSFAHCPVKGTHGAAGTDLNSAYTYCIHAPLDLPLDQFSSEGLNFPRFLFSFSKEEEALEALTDLTLSS